MKKNVKQIELKRERLKGFYSNLKVKEKPVLMNSEMVRAILAGQKTQTRLIINPQPVHVDGGYFWPGRNTYKIAWAAEDSAASQLPGFKVEPPTDWLVENACPFGKPGNRLWVRETFAEFPELGEAPSGIGYKADLDHCGQVPVGNVLRTWDKVPAKPSIHMPRWACRILLEITDIKVERIRDISVEDALAEGMNPFESEFPVRMMFEDLWHETYPGSWGRNDWVWVIEFKRVEA